MSKIQISTQAGHHNLRKIFSIDKKKTFWEKSVLSFEILNSKCYANSIISVINALELSDQSDHFGTSKNFWTR